MDYFLSEEQQMIVDVVRQITDERIIPNRAELDEKHVEKPTEFLNIGQEIEMRIIKLSLEEKKIGLSLKAMKEEEPRLEFTSYLASADSGNASMGERLGDQLQRFKKSETEE